MNPLRDGTLKPKKMRQVIARMPKLKCSAGRYYVEFHFINRSTGEMDRYRDYSGFKSFSTKREREEYGRKRVEYYKRKLKGGWVPADDKDLLFSDDIPVTKRKKISEKHLAVVVINSTYNKLCEKLRYGTIKNYSLFVRNFIDYININSAPDLTVFEITEELAGNFLNSLDCSGKFRNEYLSFLKRLFNKVKEDHKGMGLINPFDSFKKEKHKAKPTPFFRENLRIKLAEIISKEEPYLWIFIQCLYYTALRPTAELRLMQLKYFNMEDGVIFIPATISKNKKDQEIGMPKQLWELLMQKQIHNYPGDYYLFSVEEKPGPVPAGKNYFRKRFLKLRKKLGLPENIKMYNWKHTAAANLIKAGVSLKDGQLHFRHYSIDMFDHYVSDMNITDAVSIKNNYPNIV